MPNTILTYETALGFLPGVTVDMLRAMDSAGMSAEEFFGRKMAELIPMLGLNPEFSFEPGSRELAIERARQEVNICQQKNITILPYGSEKYPRMLLEIPDAPPVLYKCGEADTDLPHSLSIVGTRHATIYGLDFCKEFCSDLATLVPDCSIVSGLAYGIDSAAHNGALDHGLKTICVMGTGLQTIYPAANRNLAASIIKAGGAIITEYPYGTPGSPRNFLSRNRIIAGLTPATVVVESAARGGSLSTANYAFHYNREVFSVPGRVHDEQSAGTLRLIRENKAHVLLDAEDILNVMGWKSAARESVPEQKNLFPELEGDQGIIYERLKYKSAPMSVDMLYQETEIPVPRIISALMDMEFDGLVCKRPGSRFEIC